MYTVKKKGTTIAFRAWNTQPMMESTNKNVSCCSLIYQQTLFRSNLTMCLEPKMQ